MFYLAKLIEALGFVVTRHDNGASEGSFAAMGEGRDGLGLGYFTSHGNTFNLSKSRCQTATQESRKGKNSITYQWDKIRPNRQTGAQKAYAAILSDSRIPCFAYANWARGMSRPATVPKSLSMWKATTSARGSSRDASRLSAAMRFARSTSLSTSRIAEAISSGLFGV